MSEITGRPDLSGKKVMVKPLTRDRALEIFNLLTAQGYAVSVKHIRGDFYVEVPVRLRGDKAYGKEVEITELVSRAGYQCVRAGMLLRIA